MSVNVYKNGGLVSIAGGGGGGEDVPIATVETAGKVKPDGSSITITNDGTISTYDFIGTREEVASVLNNLPEGTTIYITDDNTPGNLPIATTETLGGVKPDGSTITVTQDGIISSVGGGSETPIATTEIAGKVKPDGTTITVTQDGTISATTQDTPIATTSITGKVKPDGSTITITQDGTISGITTPTATSNALGIVKPDNSTITINNGTLSAATQTPATATSSTLGIVKPDNSTITINNGILTAKTGSTIEIEKVSLSGTGTITVPYLTSRSLSLDTNSYTTREGWEVLGITACGFKYNQPPDKNIYILGYDVSGSYQGFWLSVEVYNYSNSQDITVNLNQLQGVITIYRIV